MIESKSFGSKAFKVINAIILILLAFSCFYPLWYTFCVSISSKAAAEGGLVTIYPIGSNVKSYSLIMGDSAFWNSFWISIKRVVIGTIWTMVVLIMMSYPLAKSKTEYKPRNVLMWILVFCMLFNGGTIPWFITVKNYGMIDTMAALVLAGSVPVTNGCKQDDGCDNRFGTRNYDLPQDTPRAGAVYTGCLLEVSRDAAEEVHHKEYVEYR